MHAIRSALAGLLLFAVAACGGEDSPGAPASTPSPTVASSATPEGPTYRSLSEDELDEVLLGVEQMPPGFSQDPPTDDGNKYFCDYDPPTEEKVRASRDFTKGGGLSAEVVRLAARQFESADDARASWDALTGALKTCKSEVYEGTTLTYSPMSVPDLGEDAVGVKIDADGVTIVQNFVLVGPVMISAGGGGAVDVDVDNILTLLEDQVDRYVDAASD